MRLKPPAPVVRLRYKGSSPSRRYIWILFRVVKTWCHEVGLPRHHRGYLIEFSCLPYVGPSEMVAKKTIYDTAVGKGSGIDVRWNGARLPVYLKLHAGCVEK